MVVPEKKPDPEHPDRPEDEPSSARDMIRQAQKASLSFASVTTVGLELGGIIGLMTLGGWWMDRQFGTTPWFLLTGAFIGVTGGLYRVFRIAREMMGP
jgi:F0F1-type ATP synthase assembly protein I